MTLQETPEHNEKTELMKQEEHYTWD